MPNNNEPQRTLWMLVCDDGFGYQLKAFYAISEEDAQRQAQQWLEEQLVQPRRNNPGAEGGGPL